MARQFLTSDSSVWADRFGNGSDGAYSPSTGTDATANTTLTGTSGGTSATAGSGTGFAANNLVFIHQSRGTGVGAWELNKISSVGSGTNWTMAYTLQNTYSSGAQVYLLKQYSSATISGGVTITGQSWDNVGLKGGIYAILCNGTISIAGTVTINGGNAVTQTAGTGGGFVGGAIANPGFSGEGTSGASVQQATANGNGGGGASASTGGGGGGGNSSSGTGGNGVGAGSGGNSAGATNLTTMVFGGGGGAGGNGSDHGAGGAGGAVVVLIGKIITVTGSITTNGGAGGNNNAANRSGGGAGAGGSTLFKGQLITLGSSLATATGGTGGTGNGTGNAGGNGSSGRIHADYSSSISGTTNPTLDSTQDNIFSDSGGSAIFAFF